jgi:type III pantothenate kinase
MLLTLDRGNSTLDAMLHGDGQRRQRLDPAAALLPFLGKSQPSRCIGVTVVPDGLRAAERELHARGLRLLLVGRDLQCPLPLDYETPATLGADRWLGALAAHREFGRAVVVDCGSATTVSMIEQDGTFRGGAIAPGLRALAAGMQAVTPHLPAADPAHAVALPARSSAASVHTGVMLAFCGAVERLCADALAALRGPATVVLTGGHADDYLRHGRLRPVLRGDLVHRGLSILGEGAPCTC